MGIAYNPSIPTEGLVYFHDMSNTQKSWKGKAVTNSMPNPLSGWNGSAFPLSHNYDATTPAHSFTYVTGVSNPVNAPGVLQYYSGGTTGYKYWSIQSNALTAGTYTVSYYARLVGGSSSTTMNNGQLWRDNKVGDQAVTGNWNPTFTTEWVRYSTTGPVTEGAALQYFFQHSGSLQGGITIQYCGFQIEPGSYASPFVAGTRANTGVLLDLSGNNTTTVNNLTYDSDNTFRFSTANDYVSMNGLASTVNRNVTLVSAFNLGTVNGVHQTAIATDYNYRYGLKLMPYYHGTSNISAWLGNSDATSDVILNSGINAQNQGWKIVAVTRNADTGLLKIYVNGVLAASTTTFTGGTAMTGTGARVGLDYHSAAYGINARIPVGMCYNRELSEAELTGIFNILRGRYGI